MTRLRWRAIARCLGVPRSVIREEARTYALHNGHHESQPVRWTMPLLLEWADIWGAPQCKLILGPDGLRTEDA